MNVSEIKNPTAKGIYFAICAGLDSRQKLLKVFPKVSFHRSISLLISEKFVEEFQNGTFSSILEQNTDTKLNDTKQTNKLKVQKWDRNETKTETDDDYASFLFPKNAPGKYIDSTDDIPDLINRLSKANLKSLEKRRKQIKENFYERGISLDLIDRIAMMPYAIGIDCNDEIFKEWGILIKIYKEDGGKKGYACLSTLVRGLYENFGVRWTECTKSTDYSIGRIIKQAKQRQKNKQQRTLF